MYEFINNQLSIPARLIYNDWSLTSYDNYLKMCERGKLTRTKEGRGKDNTAYVAVESLPIHNGIDYKEICIQKLGQFPTNEQSYLTCILEKMLEKNRLDVAFFANHKKPNGQGLSFEKQIEGVNSIMLLRAIERLFKSKNFSPKSTKTWNEIANSLKELSFKMTFKLPLNGRSLERKFKEYLTDDVKCIVHKGEGHKNSTKIKQEVSDWLIATYSLPTKITIPKLTDLYNEIRLKKGWKSLTNQAVYLHLEEPENMRKWIISRDGLEAYRNKFGHKLQIDKTDNFPNAYWLFDGSKLDFMYLQEGDIVAKLKIDVVMDYYSEKILGWSVLETENITGHIEAIGGAINTAGARPYLITYDNQAGHKSARMQELYTNLVAKEGGTHYPHKAKHHTNPIEQVFNRLQQQEISTWWFSDKQGVKVRSSKNKMNADFILENKHLLPTMEEVIKAWEISVARWNNAPHPKMNCTRNEAYTHEIGVQEEINHLEQVQLLWLEETKQITYRGNGITLKIGKKEYSFEVYDVNGDIDLEFRYRNVNKKFKVRYHPEYLNDYVQLLEVDEKGKKTLVACAEPKRGHKNIPITMSEGDKTLWLNDYKIRQIEEERDIREAKKIAERAGITNEKLIEDQTLTIKFGGSASKAERERAEDVVQF
ncbi:hypothetical protein BWK59_11730 [Flavobacterium davisii]|uniref:Integrase catalytic domain-containing protein n=1 Tax=Flavobacterium davisii TaxID=2906077 RepID=A0A246GGE7_9FLAO|nr:hypothetical protein [Flavobacterium davisii]OWP83211.1 hypothetical protein BWK59_11730 [Flavobacterium davisii]